MTPDFIVIGAGPSGLSFAILVAKRLKRSVVVYDALTRLDQDFEDSYPIGLNPRGLKALEQIDHQVREAVAHATPVEAWNIYSGTRRVFRFPSGNTVGATRGGVTIALYEECLKHPELIKFKLGHKLTDIDFESRTLTFQAANEERNITVDPPSRVVGADGVWSKCRRLWAKSDAQFAREVDVQPWSEATRLLFSSDNAETSLESKGHHIMSGGFYAALVDAQRQKWVVAVQVKKEYPFLAATEDTEDNREALKQYLTINAPLLEGLIPDDDFSKFFQRRSFAGAVVRVPRLNYDEWMVLLGDASHSVLPAAGEGINCGLEDATILCKAIEEDEAKAFSHYNDLRHHDVYALGTYAKFLLEGQAAPAEEKVARAITQVVLQLGNKIGLVGSSWTDKSFGPVACEYSTYSDMLAVWERQSRFLLPVSRMITFPLGWIIRTIVHAKRRLIG